MFEFLKRKTFFQKHKRRIIVAGIIVVLLIIVAARNGGGAEQGNTDAQLPAVSLLNIQEYAGERAVVNATGEVEALDQVELKSEVLGRVVSVPVELGQEIFAGQTIASFDAASLAAQRAQAVSDYDNALAVKDRLAAQLVATEASHQKVLVSTQNAVDAAESALQTAENNLQLNDSSATSLVLNDAYEDAVAQIQSIQVSLVSALSTADSIVGVDNVFANDAYEAGLSILEPGALTNAEFLYRRASEEKDQSGELVDAITGAEDHAAIDAALVQLEETLLLFTDLYGTLTEVLASSRPTDDLTQTTLDTLNATVNTQRTSIATSYSTVLNQQQSIESAGTSLTGFEIAYDQALLNFQTAQANAQADIEASLAQVAQAEAAVASQDAVIARANATIASVNAALSKTVIRSPISGTVAVLPVRVGELVTAGQLVGSVVNTTGLQITAFVDSDQISQIAVGAGVMIDDREAGVVTNIAPSIDPATRKVEVVIALVDAEASTLVVGTFVDVSIEQEKAEQGPILLPLGAINVTNDGAYVFVLGERDVVEQRAVELDRIVGTDVEVISGLESLTDILSSVRGVAAGDAVRVR